MTPKLLRRLAGKVYFSRGEAYFAEGTVRSLHAYGDGVKAVVRGTRDYRVRLWMKDGELDHDCTCPLGQDYEFCKHCVAVGLAWRAEGGSGDGAPSIAEQDVRNYLLGLDKEILVATLLEQAVEDERLHRRLTIQAAHAKPGTADLSVWKDAFDDALETGDYVDYRNAYDYASDIEEVIDSLDDLLQAGQADRVIGLAEYGLAEVEDGLEHVDDSDGWMSGLLGRLQDIHLAACRQVRPDPVDLAERLFEQEMDSPFDTFYRAVAVYADILGTTGIAAYHRLAEAEWAKIPALGPGDEDPERYGRRYRIASIMEALVRDSGDLDAIVNVKSRDLSKSHGFLDIARIYHEAGNAELALDWAERGWRAFSDTRRDERLRTFIADAYQSGGRHDEAMTLIWEAFAERPGLMTYRDLEHHGRHAGQWAAWREQALTLVRKHIADRKAELPDSGMWGYDPLGDHSLLVEIFLHEDDQDAAWHEANNGGCSKGLWLALAKCRELSHPADAVEIYKRHIDSLLRNTGNSVYERAVEFLESIRTLLGRSGKEAAFRPYMTEIRATHRRKRNLVKMLDRKGW